MSWNGGSAIYFFIQREWGSYTEIGKWGTEGSGKNRDYTQVCSETWSIFSINLDFIVIIVIMLSCASPLL